MMSSLVLVKKYGFPSFPIVLGLSVFYFLLGWNVLNPQNIDWLLQANNQDSVQHFVGWE